MKTKTLQRSEKSAERSRLKQSVTHTQNAVTHSQNSVSHTHLSTPHPQNPVSSTTLHEDNLLKHVTQRNQDVDQVLSLLGWGLLPNQVLIEILDDLNGYAEELKGGFSTICPYVQNRRKRVVYWVESLLNGICTSETAAMALHIPSLGSRG